MTAATKDQHQETTHLSRCHSSPGSQVGHVDDRGRALFEHINRHLLLSCHAGPRLCCCRTQQQRSCRRRQQQPRRWGQATAERHDSSCAQAGQLLHVAWLRAVLVLLFAGRCCDATAALSLLLLLLAVVQARTRRCPCMLLCVLVMRDADAAGTGWLRGWLVIAQRSHAAAAAYAAA